MPVDHRTELPTGTVTFLFSDIEGSTRLSQTLRTERYREVLERHQVAMRAAFDAHEGVERGTEGDSFFVVFRDPAQAVAAAVAAQRALASSSWPDGTAIRVRIGVHTGAGVRGGDDYVGLDVNRAARISASAHGGQIILSDSTRALVERDLPAGTDLRDLGVHRLKDLEKPERLFQVVVDGLPSDFPPPRSLGTRLGSLPPRFTSFIDREGEREAIGRLLDASRLVTITGPGGTGKTSLALTVARDVAAHYEDGAWFVPLDSLTDPGLVPAAIARALRLEVEDHRPPIDRIADFVREREVLLLLDNFEHLQPASDVVRALLADGQSVRFLVASQAPLHLDGEQEFPLAPLPVPPDSRIDANLGAVAASPAVRLFLDRARAVRPGFSLEASNATSIAAICARLDGLPLAIELAAAQVRFLSPSSILDRLTTRITSVTDRRMNLPQRQRTLEALVSWSYELLPADQQALLRRLSAFAGGAGLDEIERVVEGDPSVPDVIEGLAGLVDRSLVLHVEGDASDRYSLLETIRAFASARLDEGGETASVTRRHAQVFAELMDEAEPHLYRANRRAWLERLAREHDNVRAALDRMEATGQLETALRICAATWRFWQQTGHLVEAIPRIERLLATAERSSTPIDPRLMSRAEEAAGGMGYWQRIRSLAEIERHYQRSLEFARKSGDPGREAWALYNLSFAYDYVPTSSDGIEPDHVRATALRAEALERFRELGEDRGIAYTLWSMAGSPVAIVNPLPELRERLSEALGLFRKIDEAFGETWALLSLAMVEAEAGNLDTARSAIIEAGTLFVRDGDLSGQMVTIDALAALAARAGDARLAVRLDAVGQAARRATGTLTPPIAPLRMPIEAARAALDRVEVREEDELGATLSVGAVLQSAFEWQQGSIRDFFDYLGRLRPIAMDGSDQQ